MSWDDTLIENVCNVKGGKRLPAGHNLTDEVTFHPYIRARDIREGKINFTDPKYISDDTHQKISRYIVNEGDVIITIVGANIGDVAYVTKEFDGANLTENAVKISAKRELLDSRFLKYALLPEYAKEYMQIVASGAAQGKLGLYKIKKLPIPYPPLPIQKKIAGVLSAYDDLIENNLKRIKLLEELAQITYEEWFVRLRFPGHETTPVNPETALPEGWERLKLGDTCNLTMGQSPKSEFYNTTGEGLPFHQGVKDYGFRFPTNTYWSTEGTRYAEHGDILFSVRAPVGRLNIATEKMILGRGLAAIRHKKNAQGYICCLLKKQFFEEDMMGGGAIFNSVTKNDMLRIETVEPDQATLEKFSVFADATDREIENLHNQNQRLREARDILLPRLMTGMIDVEQYDPADLLKKVA
ncbi:MAG: restriction endonuclease subunit S [Burkholderiales bacterium]|nr:restriction endonuclease subunit S [Burkholderiales bacterium]